MGDLVLSIDAELAWGFHDQPAIPHDRLEGARTGWHVLLELLDRYEIPATWAIVGHLMLDACDGHHRDHPAPPGWFDRDPGGRSTAGDLWFAPDLVEAVQSATVDHEVASHTFSHVPFDLAEVTDRMVDAELALHKSIAKSWGESLDSFVFPRNAVGRCEKLADHGFRCYRGRPDPWYGESKLRQPAKALDLVFARTAPPVVAPSVDEYGLVNVPASLDLFGFEGLARRLAEPTVGDPIVAAASRGIEAAESGGGVFHAWLHPNNITTQTDVRRLDAVFRRMQESPVPVKTMGKIAREVPVAKRR